MAQHNETGQKGEEVASIYLADLGYKVLATNWRVQKAEIDILAFDTDVLVCIEVKTRSTKRYGEPYEFISKKKQRMLRDATTYYATQIHHDGEIRFDVISIIQNHAQKLSIKHFIDAFHF